MFINFLTELSKKVIDAVGGNVEVGKFLIVLIYLLFILSIPVLISFLFPLFKNKLNHRTKVYLYAFSTGFFIILATFGFLREAIEQAAQGNETLGIPEQSSTAYGYNILVVFGGLVTGLAFAFTLKFVISYRINKKLLKHKKLSIFVHDHSHEGHGHSHAAALGKVDFGEENPAPHVHKHPNYIFSNDDSVELAEEALAQKISGKLKVIALVLLLTHRIPEGFLIGYNLSLTIPGEFGNALFSSESNLTVAYFISLVLHMIPEELVFYYRLRDAGYGRWNALLISTIMDFLFLPFMLIGIYSGSAIAANNFGQGYLMAIIGGIFLFTSLVELFPEFYHAQMDKKRWFTTLFCLFLGISFSVLVLSFHSHGHSHAHESLIESIPNLISQKISILT